MIGKIVFLFFLVSFTSNLFSAQDPLKKGAQVIVKTKSGFLKGKIKSYSNFRESYKVLLSSGKSIRKPYDEVFRIVPPREKDLAIKNYILYKSDDKYLKSTLMKKKSSDKYQIQIHGMNPTRGRKFAKKNELVAYVSENLRLGGEHCKRVNLLRNKWVKEWKMPQYDQGFTGLCYAYTGIQMVDYWRQTKGLRISKDIALSDAVYAGLLSKMDWNSSSSGFEGGYVKNVLNGIKRKGMCRADVIQSSLNKFAKERNLNTREFYEASLHFITRKRSWSNFNSFFKAFRDKLENAVRGGVIHLFKKRKIYKKADFKLVYEALKPYIDKNNLTGFYEDIFKDCLKPENQYLNSKKIPYSNYLKIFSERSGGTQEDKFYSELNGQLNKKKMLGIEYCANVLTLKRYNGLKKNGTIKSSCWNHASLIVGRRVHEGKCQLLVRNSWGSNCRYPWECLKNKKGEEMGIWVDEKRMKRNLYKIHYFLD